MECLLETLLAVLVDYWCKTQLEQQGVSFENDL